MDTIFENRYVRDRQVVKELCWYIHFQRGEQVAFFVFVSLVSALIAFFDNPFFWGMIPLFFSLWLYLYYSQVNTILKRDKERFGGLAVIEVLVYDSFIQVSLLDVDNTKIQYENIKKVIQKEHIFLICTKGNIFYTLKKDSFTKGTKDDFLAFMSYKGIEIK